MPALNSKYKFKCIHALCSSTARRQKKKRSAPVWASFKSYRSASRSAVAMHRRRIINVSSWAHRRTNVVPLSHPGQRRWECSETQSRQNSCCLQAKGMASLRPHIDHAPSASKQCCLTRRSTGPATARGVSLPRSGFATVARQAYTARLCGPVSSNVRQHNSAVAHFRLR